MNWTTETRLQWIIRLVGIGLVSGILLSWRLWTSRRDYPLFPVWDGVPQFGPGVSALVVLFLLGLLLWVILRPGRWNVSLVLAFVIILSIQDQSRWQPWAYQYLLMLFPVAFVGLAREDRSVTGLLQFILIMVYLWGGIHKCQPGWLSVWESSLVAPLLSEKGEGVLDTFLVAFGYAVPVIEILMALGLMLRKTRLLAILAVTGTHLIILVLLGPVKGTISNSVVWPWNVVMVGMVFLLFYEQDLMIRDSFRIRPLIPLSFVTLLLMMVTPVLFYFGMWDRYLSFSLYAGQQKRFLVQVPADALDHIPEEWAPYLVDPQASDGHQILSPGTWSSKELNVPLISEWRVLRAFAQELCEEDLEGAELRFYVDHRHYPDKPKYYFSCDEIDELGRP